MQLISRLGFPRNSRPPWIKLRLVDRHRSFHVLPVISEIGMAAPGIVETFNVLRDREGVSQSSRWISSCLIVEKKLSLTALSQQLPLRLMTTEERLEHRRSSRAARE